MLAQAEVDTEEVADAIDGGIALRDWITAGVVLAVTALLAFALGRAVQHLVARLGGSRAASIMLRRLVRYVTVTAGLIYALGSLGVRIGPLLGALGIAGIALAFALQDILENFVGGLLIQIRRPFVVGDQITSGDHEGEVVDVNARTVVVHTPDGERVHLPAGSVIKEPIVNLTYEGLRRTTIDVGVDYGTDLDAAQQVLVDAASGCDGVAERPAPEALVHEFADSAVVFAVRYWHEPTIAAMWAARDEVARSVKRALDAEGITIPFPQLTLGPRMEEGREG